MHTVVNDLVEECYRAQRAKLNGYYAAGKDAPISAPYQDPVNWTGECLVHALDHRITSREAPEAEARSRNEGRVRSLTEGGYTLPWPLYAALRDFEESDLPFDRYLHVLLEKLPEQGVEG